MLDFDYTLVTVMDVVRTVLKIFTINVQQQVSKLTTNNVGEEGNWHFENAPETKDFKGG